MRVKKKPLVVKSVTDSTELAVRPNYEVQLIDFEKGLLWFLEQNGLPTEAILVSLPERATVFRNIDGVMSKIAPEQKKRSVYISKFVAAAASGLFDAALNYLWDETIYQLRRRVTQYDLSYFFDNAVTSAEKRKSLKTDEDLVRIDDSELVYGAKEIGLISELGFKHLDNIRYMRNWASAAHPNQNELTGLQLISWLETCIKQVISLPLSDTTIQIKQLLASIKATNITAADAKNIAVFFLNLTQEQVNNLGAGFYGIYTRSDTTPQTRQNVTNLSPYLWDRIDEETRRQFGIKQGKFVATNSQDEVKFSRQFLEVVGGLSYIPDGLRATEIETAVENLLTAHRNFSNFYSEPVFAQQLQGLIGTVGNIPSQVNHSYVLGLTEVFLTNGNGVAWNAEPIYKELINKFDATQATIAILSFTTIRVSSRLQFRLCQEKFLELLKTMRAKVPSSAVKELVDEIQDFPASLDKLKDVARIKQRVANLQKILG